MICNRRLYLLLLSLLVLQVMGESIQRRNQFETLEIKEGEYDTSLPEEIFKYTVPLSPERFNKRIKDLLGLDLDDYPQDCHLIIAGHHSTGYLLLYPKDRIFWVKTYQSDPVVGDLIPEFYPAEKYALFYQYMMMDDKIALKEYYKNYSETFSDSFYTNDFLLLAYYSAIFDSRSSLIEYIDDLGAGFFDYSITPYYSYCSNKRMDAVYLYVKSEEKKGRKIYMDDHGEYGNTKDIHLQTKPSNLREFFLFEYLTTDKNNPWYPLLKSERVAASWLNNQLRYNLEEINDHIVKTLNSKYDDIWKGLLISFKNDLKVENYFGCTLLREFSENPMREMPSLDKIGLSFYGVLEKDVPLLIEPFSDSVEIETVYSGEHFIAYEMGYDDYYFIEIEKPIESPVAGPDGYAMILDRTETVHGYLPKDQILKIEEDNMLESPVYRNIRNSTYGIINDPDGYVNIRQEGNSQSKIVGTIKEGEIFNYWITPSNWYIVKTRSGMRGFVYKDRIKKYERYIEEEE